MSPTTASRRYAQDTDVPVGQSRDDIERTLQRYGADDVTIASSTTRGAAVEFTMRNRRVRFLLPLPSLNDREFTHTPERGLRRTDKAQREQWQAASRARWRALLLKIKADLEAVESGIVTFDVAMYPHLVLPSGETVAEAHVPRVVAAIESGGPIPSLLALPAGDGS